MEHPLVGNLDKLSMDELSKVINDLNKKLSIAMRTGNGHLCNQVRMAIESYQNRYRHLQEEQYREQAKNLNFDDKIQIE